MISLVLVSGVQQDSEGYNQVYIWVLVMTVISLALLSLAIVFRFAYSGRQLFGFFYPRTMKPEP